MLNILVCVHFIINMLSLNITRRANSVIPNSVAYNETYTANFDHNKALLDEFYSKTEVATAVDPRTESRERQRGKMVPRDRIDFLLDKGSPFLELSQLAGWELYKGQTVRGGGVVTGIGVVENRLVMITSNDQTVSAGTYYPITVKKSLRAQEIAEENNLPCIYIVDSGGAFLPLQADIYPDKNHGGRNFYNMAKLSSMGIPQISIACGACTAGGAYAITMADETVIVNKHGQVYLGGVPLVKAATGTIVSPEDLGGAKMHCTKSGSTDHFARNEQDAFKITKDIVANLPQEASPRTNPYAEPLYPIEDVLGILPKQINQSYDPRQVIARLVDGSEFHEFKKLYGTEIVTGFASIYGMQIGIIANIGAMNSEEALKGAHFIELCEQRRIPILFMQNISGYSVGVQHEQAGIAKHGAKMVNAVSTATVPKITLIVGGSHGAGNYGMCGRAYGPQFLYMWPNARISVMAGENAAIVLATVEDGKEFGKYVKSEEVKMQTDYDTAAAEALKSWASDKNDQAFTDATGLPADILQPIMDRAGEPLDNLRLTKAYKAHTKKMAGKLRGKLGKANAQTYLDRVKQGREEGAPRPELQFPDLEKREGFDIDAFRNKIETTYDRQASAYYASARLWDDGIIDPLKTREILGLSFYVTSRNIGEQKRFGVFRM